MESRPSITFYTLPLEIRLMEYKLVVPLNRRFTIQPHLRGKGGLGILDLTNEPPGERLSLESVELNYPTFQALVRAHSTCLLELLPLVYGNN
jgi:hypothetical protein